MKIVSATALLGRESSMAGHESSGRSSRMILEEESTEQVSVEPSGRTLYAANVRASRVNSCQSSWENMVLRASRTRDCNESSSLDLRRGTDRPTTLPSFSYVTTSPSDMPPRRPRSSCTEPLSPLLIGARPLFLNSAAADIFVSKRNRYKNGDICCLAGLTF